METISHAQAAGGEGGGGDGGGEGGGGEGGGEGGGGEGGGAAGMPSHWAGLLLHVSGHSRLTSWP